MSADERTYIEAKLELLDEIRSDVKLINGKVDAMAVQQVAYAGRLALVEEESRKNHCPRAGLCVQLEQEINKLKEDKKSAHVILKFIAWVFGALSTIAGFIYICIEINPDYIALAHKRIGETQPALLTL